MGTLDLDEGVNIQTLNNCGSVCNISGSRVRFNCGLCSVGYRVSSVDSREEGDVEV